MLDILRAGYWTIEDLVTGFTHLIEAGDLMLDVLRAGYWTIEDLVTGFTHLIEAGDLMLSHWFHSPDRGW